MAGNSNGKTENRISEALGTVDRVIQENKIFTALTKMPNDVKTTLLQNGWIGIDSSGENPIVLSLHKNLERVKTVVKRYEPGLIWMDEHSRGVNWSELHPKVVVNRFPRDDNAVLKLCGHAMAGKPQFDSYYPRAYPITEVTVASRFTSDYSLTACASLLHAFVDGYGANCSKSGQVPISIIRFAVNKCDRYADGDQIDLTGDGAEWRTFFEHCHRVVDNNQKFAAPTGDAEEELGTLAAASRRALQRLTARRPQTAMDGRRNVWTIKCNRPTAGFRLCLSNRIDDILERCGRAATDGDCIVQKYVETPLLTKNNDRFDVRAWFVVSTLDGHLAAWLYQSCCVHRRPYRLSVDAHRGQPAHVSCTKSHRHVVRGPVLTCGLRQLQGKLRAAAESRGDSDVCQGIRHSIVSATLAAADVLNLRPNCFELFQATFVVGDDVHPWLIDIESDPWIARDHCYHNPESSVADGVAKGLAKILTCRHRESKTKIGMFDLLHRSSFPGQPYEPRPFSEKPVSKKCHKTSQVKDYNVIRHERDEFIKTYVEKIQADDAADYRPQIYLMTEGAKLKNHNTAVLENNPRLSDLEKSMNRLKNGPAIDEHEAKYCLSLLDKWKTKVMSAQRFYKTVLISNRT